MNPATFEQRHVTRLRPGSGMSDPVRRKYKHLSKAKPRWFFRSRFCLAPSSPFSYKFRRERIRPGLSATKD